MPLRVAAFVGRERERARGETTFGGAGLPAPDAAAESAGAIATAARLFEVRARQVAAACRFERIRHAVMRIYAKVDVDGRAVLAAQVARRQLQRAERYAVG